MCISYLKLATVKGILKRTASFLVPFFMMQIEIIIQKAGSYVDPAFSIVTMYRLIDGKLHTSVFLTAISSFIAGSGL